MNNTDGWFFDTLHSPALADGPCPFSLLSHLRPPLPSVSVFTSYYQFSRPGGYHTPLVLNYLLAALRGAERPREN